MPFETRRIMFNYAELKEALFSYGKKYNMSFPEGEIIKVSDSNPKEYAFNPLNKFREGGSEKSLPFIVSFILPTNNEYKYINLPTDFMIGALVEYCLDHKIMMRRDSFKMVEIIEFGIVLEMTDKLNEENIKNISLSFDE
jgi:hypothetical protein